MREAFLDGYFDAVDVVAAAAGRGRRAHAADHLRAREGRLRAALRAQQPPRLGAASRWPGSRACWRSRCRERRDRHRGDRPPRPRRAAPPARRAPAERRRGHPRLPARRGQGRRAPRGRRRRSSSSCATRAASSRARCPARACRCATSSTSLRRGAAASRCATRTPSCPRSATSTCTSPARAATRSSTRSSAPTCARSTACEGVSFAVWAPAARSVSVVGDFNSWDGRLHPMRSLGSSGIWELFVPGVPEGSALQVRDPHPGRRARRCAPTRTRAPPRCRRRPRRSSSARATSGRTTTGWSAATRAGAAAARADLDLRGPPRLVAAQPARGQPRADLPRAGRRAGPVRQRARLHAHRAAAGHGPPVQRLVGLPGDLVLRPDARLRARPTTCARSSTACTATASA